MHRIDTPTAVAGMFGAGKNGYTNGDNATGQSATQLDADVFNAYQEEICAVIEGAGIALIKGEHTQLLKALKELFLTANVQDAKTILELDKVGNWPAVQANGGLHSSGNHRIYIDWGDDGKAHLTVDTSDEGELFTTVNPPTPAQSNAYPMWGGNLNENASITVISSVLQGNVGDFLYGPMFRTTLKARGGDKDFKDGASFFMRIVEHVGTLAYGELVFDGFSSVQSFVFDQNGNFHAAGNVQAGNAWLATDGNIYGSVWGGYLSNWVGAQIGAQINNNNTWVSNTFQPRNTADLGSGWERDSVTGRIRQWGFINYGRVGFYQVNFPITFPNVCANVQVTAANNGSTKFADNCSTAGNVNQAGFTCGQDGQGSYWEATGW